MWVRKQEEVNDVITSYEKTKEGHQTRFKKTKKEIFGWDMEIGAKNKNDRI